MACSFLPVSLWCTSTLLMATSLTVKYSIRGFLGIGEHVKVGSQGVNLIKSLLTIFIPNSRVILPHQHEDQFICSC